MKWNLSETIMIDKKWKFQNKWIEKNVIENCQLHSWLCFCLLEFYIYVFSKVFRVSAAEIRCASWAKSMPYLLCLNLLFTFLKYNNFIEAPLFYIKNWHKVVDLDNCSKLNFKSFHQNEILNNFMCKKIKIFYPTN